MVVRAISRQYGSTGLGPDLQRLVDLTKGRIGASGRDSEGSKFRIEVDLSLSAISETAAPASTTTAGGAG